MNGSREGQLKRIRSSTAEFLIFTGQTGQDTVEVRYEDETIWLTQKLMAALFDVSVHTINEHLKNVFESGEVAADSAIRKFRITASDGKSYSTNHYNLDAIISVGYRVNSIRATQFRQWATGVLRDFAIRGYVLDLTRVGDEPARIGVVKGSREAAKSRSGERKVPIRMGQPLVVKKRIRRLEEDMKTFAPSCLRVSQKGQP